MNSSLKTFRLPEDFKVRPVLSDDFRYMDVDCFGKSVRLVLIPLELGSAKKVTLTLTQKIYYRVGNLLYYGAYIEDSRMVTLVHHALEQLNREDQALISEYWLKYRTSLV